MIGHFEVTQPIGLADAKCYKDNYYNNFIFEKATPKHYIPILANLYLVASCHPILDILHRTLKKREKDNNNVSLQIQKKNRGIPCAKHSYGSIYG